MRGTESGSGLNGMMKNVLITRQQTVSRYFYDGLRPSQSNFIRKTTVCLRSFTSICVDRVAVGMVILMKKATPIYRNCPVCGCKNADLLFPVNLYAEDLKLPSSYDAVQCSSCGMCYADTSASEKDYEQYYSNFNYYSTVPSDGETAKEEHILRYRAIEQILLQYSGHSQRIIDIGFGKGELLQYLQEKNYERLAGMDPSEDSVILLNQKGIDVFCSSIQKEIPQVQKGKYNLVIMIDVLEHLLLPNLALQNIRKLLKPSGHLILGLPIFNDLSKYRLPLINIINHEHINFFSKTTLRLLTERNGFHEIESLQVDVEIERESRTHGILAIYRMDDLGGGSKSYYDGITGSVLRGYSQMQAASLSSCFNMLKDLAESRAPVAIWGVGTYLRYLWYESAISLCNVQMLVDGNVQKQSHYFAGFRIQPPQQLNKFEGMLLIASMRYQNEIAFEAKKFGFCGKIRTIPTMMG